MSRHARIEELSDTDSDPEVVDISSISAPGSSSAISASQRNPTLIPVNAIPATSDSVPQKPTHNFDASQTKNWVCLYPLYWDSSRSRSEGRRVGRELAVPNPLARTIADAVSRLGLRCLFEAGKMHPKDWANVGRVRVEFRDEASGKPMRAPVKNKHHLYILVAQYLHAHPTRPEDVLKTRIDGLPHPDEPPAPPAVPRGWKINAILPLHSPAVSGGGVSDNFLKDMMAEMQGLPPGAAGAAGGGAGNEKKDKGKKKKK